MSTTVTNTNPITITGGTMAAGARATIYPNQIKRSFKVVAVELTAGASGDSFTIGDNSTANNVLVQGTIGVANAPFVFAPDVPVTWGDWAVTVLSNVSNKVLVYIK